MKPTRFKLNIALALSALTLSSCTEELYTSADIFPSLTADYLVLNNNQVDFTSEGGTQMLKIDSSAEWEVSELPEWLSMQKSDGTTSSGIKFTAVPNPSPTAKRTALVTIHKTGGERPMTRTITVSQQESKPSLEVDLQTLSFVGKGGTQNIKVTTNLSDLQVSASVNWLHGSYSNGTLAVTADPCVAVDSRQGTVTLTSPSTSLSKTVNVSQVKAQIGETTGEIGGAGGQLSWNFNADLNWTISSNANWLSVAPASGAPGSQTVNVTAEPQYTASPRQGVLTLHYLGAENKNGSQIITQSGRTLSLDKSSMDFTCEASSQILTVNGDVEWQVVSKPEWVKLDKESGTSGPTSISVSVEQNSVISSRSGNLEIREARVGMIERTLPIRQEGFDFSKITGMQFGWQSGSQTLHLPFSGSWTTSLSAGWVTLSQYSGKGEADLVISVSRNDAANSRTANLSFTSDGKTYTVKIIQDGQFLTVENSSSRFDANGGELNFNLSTNIDIVPSVEYAGIDANWVSYNKLSNQSYAISVAPNPSSLERKAAFVLTPTSSDVASQYANGVKFQITQSGRTISSDVSTITSTAAGGSTSAFHITAFGNYEVVRKNASDTWISINPSNATNSYQLFIGENPSSNERVGYVIARLLDLPNSETKEIEIKVTQAGRDIKASISNFRVKNSGGTTESFVITADGSYLVAKNNESDTWFDIVKESANDTYKLMVSENPPGQDRTGLITARLTGLPNGENKSIEITITQSDKQKFIVNGVEFNMIYVEGGTFQMGSNDSDADADEKPVHSVTVSDFLIGQTEVTQGLWKAVMGSNPSNFAKGDNYPVERVSWEDCQTFISKVNNLTGKKFRLLTEAEWEYAARGGRNSMGYKYSGSNNVGDVAWYDDNSGSTTHPVGTKKANELGIYDMSGNVWEWCQDWYGSYPNHEPSSGSIRVRRGGSWNGISGGCRVAYRGGNTPSNRGGHLGLRLAL